MTRGAFVRRYGGIYEHSAWVAETAWDRGAGAANADELPALLAACVDRASDDAKLALIRAHPDLAGRAAISGTLTTDSTAEQASAGIDRCTPDDYARFQRLNDAYKRKFGFPFVMAVRHSTRDEILAAFERRLQNDGPTEFRTAISEIHRIARLRLDALRQAD